jgi:hypothetical protein
VVDRSPVRRCPADDDVQAAVEAQALDELRALAGGPHRDDDRRRDREQFESTRLPTADELDGRAADEPAAASGLPGAVA